jgi:hypothetical protein
VETPPLFEELPPYQDAEAFVHALSPASQLWRSTGGIWNENDAGGARNWIFRGQTDATWGLSPKAMRAKEFVYYAIGRKSPFDPKSLKEQLAAEFEEVQRFVRRCVRTGLPLPEDSQWFRNRSLTHDAFGPKKFKQLQSGVDFPFALERSLFALAQHHGVPTRLLDWSESPMVAAYFACRTAAETEKRQRDAVGKRHFQALRKGILTTQKVRRSARRLAVWALRISAVSDLEDVWRKGKLEPTLAIVEAPFESNPNLRAQRGIFSLLTYHTARKQTDFHLPSIEEVISAYEGSKHNRMPNAPWLRKLTLPHAQAPSLLRLLNQFNVNAATLFPGYDGVVRSIEEREFFD